MRTPGLALVTLLCAGGIAVAAGQPSDPVQVHYPRGDCETGVLEVEVFSRSLQRWQPHPEHWRILADTCQQEDAGELLNELRVRCIDLDNLARASAWRTGVLVYEPAQAPGCVVPQRDLPPRADPRIVLSLPPAGEPVRNLTKTAPVVGKVALDHDFAVLVDTRIVGESRESTASALEGWLGSVAPLLGPVRVALLPFEGPDESSSDPRPASAPAAEPSAAAASLRRRLAGIWNAPASAGLTAALRPVLDEHASAGGDGRSLSVVVIVAGDAALPFGRGAAADPHRREALLAAVDRALELRVSLRILVLSEDERELVELVDRVRERIERRSGPGGLQVLADAAGLPAALSREMPMELRDLRVVNLANGVLADPLQFGRAGPFDGRVSLETGRNQLRVRAVLSDGRELVADFDRSFDASRLRDHLRAQEAERIQKIRARDGIIEVEVEDR